MHSPVALFEVHTGCDYYCCMPRSTKWRYRNADAVPQRACECAVTVDHTATGIKCFIAMPAIKRSGLSRQTVGHIADIHMLVLRLRLSQPKPKHVFNCVHAECMRIREISFQL